MRNVFQPLALQIEDTRLSSIWIECCLLVLSLTPCSISKRLWGLKGGVAVSIVICAPRGECALSTVQTHNSLDLWRSTTGRDTPPSETCFPCTAMASTFRLRPRYLLGRTRRVDGCIKPNFSDSRKEHFKVHPSDFLGSSFFGSGGGFGRNLSTE